MFPEALVLHYLDDLDSKMESMRAHFEREQGNESAWSSYNPSLGRPLLNSTKFLEKPPANTPSEPDSSSKNGSQPAESATAGVAVDIELDRI
jgi:3'-5' exoribonuclease